MVTSLVALDLKAAFDVVWHPGLIYKMQKLDFNPLLIKSIKTLLCDRKFVIRLPGILSDTFNMRNGTPQGSVLSPILFNIYLHDIPLDNNIKITQFADDTTIYYTHKNPRMAQQQLNNYIKKISEFFDNWKLILNESKTEFINIIGTQKDTKTHLRKGAKQMKILVGEHTIHQSNHIRLLGLYLQKNNKFNVHIKTKLEKARKAKHCLIKILKNKFIEPRIKVCIYKQFIRPILSYACTIWAKLPNTSSHQMELIRRLERSCLKMATNLRRKRHSYKHVKNSEIYERSGCIRFDRFVLLRHCEFYSKCSNSQNNKIRDLISPDSVGAYPSITSMYDLHTGGNLMVNDQLLIFHKRYNGMGTVYNTDQ